VNDARLIGLYAPRMQSGKTAVAAILAARGFKTVKFAAPLKLMTSAFLKSVGIPEKEHFAYIEGELKEKTIPGIGVTTRHLMRTLGKEWGRDNVNANVWVILAITRAKEELRKGRSVVIDDLRFPNEYRAILAAGGEAWRIVRKDIAYKSDGHSEALLEGEFFDVTVKNTGTLEDLKRRVSAILELGSTPGELPNDV
jgi:hypothetical protein